MLEFMIGLFLAIVGAIMMLRAFAPSLFECTRHH